MGIAIIIPSISFASNNLGTVTLAEQVPLQSLSINGPSSVAGSTNAAEYTVGYNPLETTQRGVVWSVVSGGTFATIEANTGVLTVLSAASAASSVTIRATSTANSSIYVDKVISVVYHIPLDSRTNYISLSAAGHYAVGLTIPAAGKVKALFAPSVLYGMSVLGYKTNSASTDNQVQIGLKKDSTFHIEGVMAGKTFLSADAPVANTKYLVEMSASEMSCSPSLGTFTEGQVTYNEDKPIAIGAYVTSANAYYGKFQGKIYGVEIYDGNNALTHCLIPQADTSLLDTVTGTVYSLTGEGTYGTD